MTSCEKCCCYVIPYGIMIIILILSYLVLTMSIFSFIKYKEVTEPIQTSGKDCNITTLDNTNYDTTKIYKLICYTCADGYVKCYENLHCDWIFKLYQYIKVSLCINIDFSYYIRTTVSWNIDTDYVHTNEQCDKNEYYIYTPLTLSGTIAFIGTIITIRMCCTCTCCGFSGSGSYSSIENGNCNSSNSSSTTNNMWSSFENRGTFTPSTPQYSMTQSLNRETSPYTGENRYHTSYAWERN